MVCYYKEMFGLGLFIAFLIFGIVTLFEDVISEWFRKIQDILNLK
jgi:hypothetical protein